MTFEEVIETFPGRLTKTDRRIIDELLANPREGALLSLPEIANRAAAHPTSAVRLAQKLGYSGYPELRSQLQSEMLDVLPPADRVRARRHKEVTSTAGAGPVRASTASTSSTSSKWSVTLETSTKPDADC